jgi:hypothetical protein
MLQRGPKTQLWGLHYVHEFSTLDPSFHIPILVAGDGRWEQREPGNYAGSITRKKVCHIDNKNSQHKWESLFLPRDNFLSSILSATQKKIVTICGLLFAKTGLL